MYVKDTTVVPAYTDTTVVYTPQIHYRHDRRVQDGHARYRHDRRKMATHQPNY